MGVEKRKEHNGSRRAPADSILEEAMFHRPQAIEVIFFDSVTCTPHTAGSGGVLPTDLFTQEETSKQSSKPARIFPHQPRKRFVNKPEASRKGTVRVKASFLMPSLFVDRPPGKNTTPLFA